MPRSITQTTHPLSICNYPEEKLITAAVPSSPHYSPWARAHPQSISVSSTQGTHQFGFSHHSKAQGICQHHLPSCSQGSSQSVLVQKMFCKCHMDPNPTAGRQSSSAASVCCPWHSELSAPQNLASLGSRHLQGGGISCLGGQRVLPCIPDCAAQKWRLLPPETTSRDKYSAGNDPQLMAWCH